MGCRSPEDAEALLSLRLADWLLPGVLENISIWHIGWTLNKMSGVEKSLESLTVREQYEYHQKNGANIEEAIGTIIVDERETGRKTLRPQPLLDANDPLVGTWKQKFILDDS